MRLAVLKRLLVRPPMPLAQARQERLSKTVALAVFASDPCRRWRTRRKKSFWS